MEPCLDNTSICLYIWVWYTAYEGNKSVCTWLGYIACAVTWPPFPYVLVCVNATTCECIQRINGFCIRTKDKKVPPQRLGRRGSECPNTRPQFRVSHIRTLFEYANQLETSLRLSHRLTHYGSLSKLKSMKIMDVRNSPLKLVDIGDGSDDSNGYGNRVVVYDVWWLLNGNLSFHHYPQHANWKCVKCGMFMRLRSTKCNSWPS